MGRDSLFGKLRKILENPQTPAHIQQQAYGVEAPWHKRLWKTIGPPSAVPGQSATMNQSQRRMLLTTFAIVVPVLTAWGIYGYVSAAPERARIAFDAGMARLGPSDFAGAVTKFSESISISETANAYMERGNAYQNLNQTDKALSDWSRAIELDANFAAAFTARATYYRVSGDPAKALPDLNRSVELAPSVDGYFQRGQVYFALGQFNQAIEDYDRAILQRREAPYVYLARSMARRAAGDEAGYVQDQRTAAQLLGVPQR
jgi:tetratricopeptide (TPR) repeat protein